MICLAQGDVWNHFKFQGAMQAEDTLHVVVGFQYGAYPAVAGRECKGRIPIRTAYINTLCIG